ncbi:transcription initiation factor TFIID subunit 11-like [Xenia sp. Carnegie-2017]|uniref:transcription initiation factor TFIID subunit 11-like n=1 Tax=Xenia sp. Carnegie-2017 TaxID=2897299 RepID=UPI001F04C2F3|nr:transcription initiation factor TFIID subunit 11-like [Xenia sp. Carnegie-2017]
MANLSSDVEAVVKISPERHRITFNHALQMHAFSNQDFLVHGHVIADCPTPNNTRSAHPERDLTNNNDATYRCNNNINNCAAIVSTDVNNTAPAVIVAPSLPLVSYAVVVGTNLSKITPPSTNGSSTPFTSNTKQPAPDCATDASVSSAPSEGSTDNLGNSSPPTSSPVRRRGKRRHSPTSSPQPEEKHASHDDGAIDDADVDPDPGDIPLHQDDEEIEDNTDDDGTDMDNENAGNTDEDDDDEIGNGPTTSDNNHDDDNDDDDIDDSQHSDGERGTLTNIWIWTKTITRVMTTPPSPQCRKQNY